MTSKNQYEQSQGSFATRTHGLCLSKGDCSLKWRPPRPDACRRICVASMGMPRPCCTGSREISMQIDCEYYEILAKNAYLARKVFEENNSTTRRSGTSFIKPHPKASSFPWSGQDSREKLCNSPRHKRREKNLHREKKKHNAFIKRNCNTEELQNGVLPSLMYAKQGGAAVAAGRQDQVSHPDPVWLGTESLRSP
ncbi:hypothetical protein E2320_009791 [Naja naja]|nr:hypothetical protein E2320_009791 [Naja naja]